MTPYHTDLSVGPSSQNERLFVFRICSPFSRPPRRPVPVSNCPRLSLYPPVSPGKPFRDIQSVFLNWNPQVILTILFLRTIIVPLFSLDSLVYGPLVGTTLLGLHFTTPKPKSYKVPLVFPLFLKYSVKFPPLWSRTTVRPLLLPSSVCTKVKKMEPFGRFTEEKSREKKRVCV